MIICMYSTIKFSTNAFYSCKVILGRISLQSPSHMAVHIQFSYNFLTTRVNYYEQIILSYQLNKM